MIITLLLLIMEDPALVYCEVVDSKVDTQLALQKLEVNEPTYCEVDDLKVVCESCRPPVGENSKVDTQLEDTPVSPTLINIAQLLRRIPTPRSVTVFSRTCQRCQRESSLKAKVILTTAVAIFAILSIIFMALYFTAERKYKARVYQNSSLENHNTSHWKNDTCKPCVYQNSNVENHNTSHWKNDTCKPCVYQNSSLEYHNTSHCKNDTCKPCVYQNSSLENHSGVTEWKSCHDVYRSGKRIDGVYRIDPDGLGAFNVRCDMSTNGEGWTIFQRRFDGSVDFYLKWKDYKEGFGNLNGEFWLGLDKIHRLSKSGQNVLRIDLEDFENNTRHAIYSTFAVANEAEKYKLTVERYSGDATDSLGSHNGSNFTTRDMDNDSKPDGNCAVTRKGAWWYHNCHDANLNGEYLPNGKKYFARGIKWYGWKRKYYSLKKSEMKI